MSKYYLLFSALSVLIWMNDAQAQSGRKKKSNLTVQHSTAETQTRSETGNTMSPLEVTNPSSMTDSLVEYAKTLIGTPYVYASTDPAVGFDCSGFITHVFNHFKLSVPRSSVDFTNYGTELPKDACRAGDLILFTGTDSTIRVVGHMGILVANDNGKLKFIHSTSGHANGVTITPLNDYYMGRFVKTIRVFKE
jgi:cell wall-associated NlpC family hydrolase